MDDWDDYDPDDRPAREEPYCYDCVDSGTVPGRWLMRRRDRPCPNCYGPNLLDRIMSTIAGLRWRLHYARRRRRGELLPTDQRPF